MRVARLVLAVFALLGLSLLRPPTSNSGGMGISTGPCSVPEITTLQFTDSILPFHLYKVPVFRSTHGNRDLEFLWSDTYAQQGKPLVPPGSTDENDLDRFAKTICEQQFSNPFGFPYTDIQLVYDYLNARLSYRDSLYNPNTSFIGFRVASPDPDSDRTHVDTYLYEPTLDKYVFGQNNPLAAGQYPSSFTSAAEDSLTLSDPATYHRNSLHFFGPPYTNVDDTGPLRWTRPDTIWNQGFDHEFEHCLNNDKFANSPPVSFVHMLASAAEAIGGMAKDPPRFDVPYTWNLIRSDPGGNYQAWLSFAAYVAYNFRGVDTTSAGRADDLLFRWARQPSREVTSLSQRLSPAECAECTTRVYFQNRSPQDRLRLLLHNWRTAQYVNRTGFAPSQGDFGFPPQFKFDPIRDTGNWRNLDTLVTDSTNVAHEVTVTLAQIGRDLSFAGPRGGSKAHAVSLERFGSDYWVVRSDAGIQAVNRDLVIRISPEGTCSDVRLMASAVTYSNQPGAGDSLWKHPEWATSVVGPVSVDVKDASAGVGAKPVEIVVPNFGATHKAVLVVITTSQLFDSGDAARILSYRLNAALRTGTYLDPNPAVTFRDGTFLNLPAWHPQGDSIAFVRNVQPGGTFGVIHVRSISQSGSRMLVPGSLPHSQTYPEWSPRGDWVAFMQESTATDCNIHAYDTKTGELRHLATTSKHEIYPAFSPNGQQLVYVRIESASEWQLRRINLDGSNDVLLLSRSPDISSPRWSPDGASIYFTSSTALYAVPSNGGTAIDKSQLIPSAAFFDLPLGMGRIVAQDSWVPPTCGTNTRLVARDTTTNESEVLFFNSGINPTTPRWSFDNTRVAFKVDSAGNSDIRVGQVGYNHAPHLTNASDALIQEHTPVSFWLNATDSDGEPLTFQAVYLPPGASLSSSGQLTWPDPQPQGSKFYITYRAIDPSGGVDQRVVLYDVEILPGGCPMVDGLTESGWQLENTVLGRSLTGEPGTDYYRVRAGLVPVRGNYQLRIRENERELTTLDQAALLAVDHPTGARSFSVDGRIVLGNRVPAARVLKRDGTDITPLLGGIGEGYWGSPGETLLVDMTLTASGAFGISQAQDFCLNCPGGGEGDPKEEQIRYHPGAEEMRARGAQPAAATDQNILEQTGILYQRPDGSGGWRTAKHYYPRQYSDEAYFDSLGSGSLRVVFVGRHRLTFLGRIEQSATQPTVQPLPISAARHSRFGNVMSAVAGSDGSTTVLAPSDTVTMEFTAPPVADGLVRDLFLVARGVYTTVTSPAQLQAARLPTRFALAQNRPNPFSRATTIRFELPVPAKVRLEIFDLAGRRVRVLVNREYPAGYHSVGWDKRDESAGSLRPGVYVYRLSAGEYDDQKKMILLP